jgi:hypothetical protein
VPACPLGLGLGQDFSYGSLILAARMDITEQKEECLRVCNGLREDILKNILDVETRVCSSNEKFATKSTVCIAIFETEILGADKFKFASFPFADWDNASRYDD